MNATQLQTKLKSLLPGTEIKVRFGNRLAGRCNSEQLPFVLQTIKSLGFAHLSNITCVDWPEKNIFDIIYNIWSYEHKTHLVMKSSISRENPAAPTVHSLWPSAQVYERELHEMFGVVFQGNPDLRPLFLHNWRDIPPLRKDFDTEKYSRKLYFYEGSEAARGGKQ